MRLHPVSIPYRALTESTNLLIGAVVGGVVVLQGEIIAAVSTVGLVFAGVFGYLLIREALYYYRFSYSLGEDTLEIDSGIISRRQREIPFGRIQNVDIVQDPLARIVGIAVVTVETAGGDGTEAALKYVDHDEAERIRRDVQHQKRSDDDDETAETDSSGVENAADTELPKDDTWVAEPPAGETMANGGNQNTTRLHPFTAPLEALRLGFLAASSAFFLVAIGSGFVPSLDIDLLFVLFPLGFVLGAGYAIARYFRFEYELTGDTFDISSGVFARQHREIPVHRVQNIDIGRSLFQRLVGLAVVSVETAGGGESEARLKFVDHETARRLQNLRALAKRGWIEEDISENRYHIYPAGRGVTVAFSTLIEELTAADRLGTLHTMLPDDIVADAAVLSTGELIVGEREAPFAAVNELLGFVRRIGSLKMCVPAINPRYVSILEDRSSSSRIELLGTGDAFETIENVEPSSFETLSESSAVEMLVVDERPPFATCLSPEDAAVITYDERMRIHGLVVADDEGSKLYGWIERQYESFKRSAEGY